MARYRYTPYALPRLNMATERISLDKLIVALCHTLVAVRSNRVCSAELHGKLKCTRKRKRLAHLNQAQLWRNYEYAIPKRVKSMVRQRDMLFVTLESDRASRSIRRDKDMDRIGAEF